MAKFDDYEDGTAFIYLFPEDFKSKYRFEQYANFMGQDANRAIQIPIDSHRARGYRDYQKRYNLTISCTDGECWKCGWNPKVEDKRKKKIRQGLEKTVEAWRYE